MFQPLDSTFIQQRTTIIEKSLLDTHTCMQNQDQDQYKFQASAHIFIFTNKPYSLWVRVIQFSNSRPP